MLDRGVLLTDIASSLISVSMGYILGFVLALPMAILMAWYLPVRNVIQPWILFIRNIPPLAYVPLIVMTVGVDVYKRQGHGRVHMCGQRHDGRRH